MGRTRGHIQAEVEDAYEYNMRRQKQRHRQQQEKKWFKQCGPKCKTTIGLSLLALSGYTFYKFK